MKRILIIGMLMIAAGLAAIGTNTDATVKQVVGTQTYIGLSTDTKPTGPDEGSTFYETNTGRSWIYTGSAWALRMVKAGVDTTSLFAPGYTDPVSVAGYSKATFYVTVEAINTTATVALYAKKGNAAWTIVGDSLSVSANGDYAITWSSVATADSVKGRFVSETGGTAVRIRTSFGLGG